MCVTDPSADSNQLKFEGDTVYVIKVCIKITSIVTHTERRIAKPLISLFYAK